VRAVQGQNDVRALLDRSAAGAVDRRDTRPDGTVLDLLDTWYEVNGVRTLERTVVA
jgi:hypothetical protein